MRFQMPCTRGIHLFLFFNTISITLLFLLYKSIISDFYKIPKILRTSETCSVKKVVTKNVIILHVEGNLTCLLDSYTKELSVYRQSIISNKQPPLQNTTLPVHSAIGHGGCKNCDYFGQIVLFDNVMTIKVSWQKLIDSNWTKADYPIQYYYKKQFLPTKLCRVGTTEAECLYHITNQSDVRRTYILPPHPVNKVNQGYPEHVLFSHIVQGGEIDERGNIRTGKLILIVTQCMVKRFIARPVKVKVDELLMLNQFWGDTYYHAQVESMERVAPYLEFLKANPSIFIYVGSFMLKNNFRLLGISEDRLIERSLTHNVQARIIYVPQGTPCGSTIPLQAQLIQKHYQDYIQKNLNPGPWNSVVQICRSKRRFLIEEKQVASLLTNYAKMYNFTYEQFRDDPTPSYNETLRMFSRARIIVAPHGAGLANTLYANPDTRVVEVLQSRHVNGCFYNLIHRIGQVYVGLISLKPNELVNLSVDVKYLEQVINSMMKSIRNK